MSENGDPIFAYSAVVAAESEVTWEPRSTSQANFYGKLTHSLLYVGSTGLKAKL